MNDDVSNTKVVRLHNVGQDWPHLRGVHGIGAYWNRALMMDGTTVLVHGERNRDLDLLLEDYAAVGVRPNPVYVPNRGNGFYGDIVKDNPTMEALRIHVGRGGKIEVFSSSFAAQEFSSAAGFQWDQHIVSPTPECYRTWVGKGEMRRRLAASVVPTVQTLCPSNHIVDSLDELRHWVSHFSADGAHGVVVKRPDMASGEGMVFLPKGGDPESFIRAHWDPAVGAIVEGAYEHYPFSMVYLITDSGVSFRFASLQWQGHNIRLGDRVTMKHLIEGDLDHRGNMTAPAGHDIGPLKWNMISAAADAVRPLMGMLQQDGYRGLVCCDLAQVTGMASFALELNPRVSHSMYVEAFRAAVQRHFSENVWVIAANVEGLDPSLTTYAAARSRVSNLCTSEAPAGVLFYHTPLLPLDLRKCGLIGIGRSFGEARDQFEYAEAELQDVRCV